MILTTTDHALRDAGRGWKTIPVMGKRPVGTEWQKRATSDQAKVARMFAEFQHDGHGVLIGQQSDLIDFDIDSVDAGVTFEKLFEGTSVQTPCFQSTRGKHYLFRWTDKLPQGSIKIVIDGLEIRLGNGLLGCQSVFPPSNGRTWVNDPDDCPVVEIPAVVIDRINARYAEIHKPKALVPQQFDGGSSHTEGMLNVPKWLAKHGREIVGRTEGSDGVTRFHVVCPNIDRHTTANSWRDCAITQSATGVLGGSCFHSSCGMSCWHELKAAIGEPCYSDYHEPEDYSDVDIRGITEAKPISTERVESASTSNAITIRTAGELIRDFPTMRPPVIEGLIRRGETLNIVAAPKMGKSWLSLSMGLDVCTGGKVFDRFWATRGKVLIIDNELHPETSAHRLAFQRPDGRNVRPTLVLVDDPQTDASAVSQRENDKRESVICNTIPGLAGPTRKTSVLVAVTVKAVGDAADRLLDRERHPEWHGKRTALLRSIPTNTDLWNQYAEILRECQRADEPIDRATDFYRDNQPAMDEGGEASWPARYNAGEISGIQFGMGLKISSPSAFASEYQNCPLVLQEFSHQTDADKIVLRINGRARGVVPLEVETLTCGVDVQKNYLVYTVTGFAPDATPFIVDYGTFPDQKTNYFDRRSATRTIERAFPEGDDDARLWAALDGLVTMLSGREWKREDGLSMSLKKLCIDVRFKGLLIKRYIKQSKHKDVLLAAQGIHVSPGSAGINDREAKPGEISKHHFRLPPMSAGLIVRTVSFDSAEYISKVHDALNTPRGQTGAMTLFDAEPHLHRCYADQLCAEYSTWVEAKGRKKRVWNLKPNGGDNDFLDSTKLSFVAAYVTGVEPKFGPKMVAKPIGQPVATKRSPRYSSI